jgi:hypothetical protein
VVAAHRSGVARRASCVTARALPFNRDGIDIPARKESGRRERLSKRRGMKLVVEREDGKWGGAGEVGRQAEREINWKLKRVSSVLRGLMADGAPELLSFNKVVQIIFNPSIHMLQVHLTLLFGSMKA